MKLGDRVKDKIDGFEGIIIATCHYINGCVQHQVQPEKLDDYKPIKPEWIDTIQLELIEKNVIKLKEKKEPAPIVEKEYVDLTNFGTGGLQKNPPSGIRR